MLILLRIFILYLAVSPIKPGTLNDSNTLMIDMMRGYNHRLRPVINQSNPISVYFSFDLMTIQDFNEVEGKISVVGLMYLGWTDEKLTWNASMYGDTDTLMMPLNEVWHPTIVLSNSFHEIHDVGADWMVVEYKPNGGAIYVPGDVFTSSCAADVTFYPFDYQICYLVFVSWGFPSGKLVLNLWATHVYKTYFTENGEWQLANAVTHRLPGKHKSEVDVVAIELTIKRRSKFLVVNVILPVVFMSLINILVFILPVESGERVSYAITVLLSLAVFLTLVVNNLPKSSQPMAVLCYYLMFTLVASVCMCIVTIFNLRLFYMNTKTAIPNCLKTIIRIMSPCGSTTPVSGQEKRVNNDEEKRDNNGNETRSMVSHVENMTHVANQVNDDRIFQNRNKDGEKTTDISWRDVSLVVDRVFFVTFLTVLIIINGIFLSAMSKNKMQE